MGKWFTGVKCIIHSHALILKSIASSLRTRKIIQKEQTHSFFYEHIYNSLETKCLQNGVTIIWFMLSFTDCINIMYFLYYMFSYRQETDFKKYINLLDLQALVEYKFHLSCVVLLIFVVVTYCLAIWRYPR